MKKIVLLVLFSAQLYGAAGSSSDPAAGVAVQIFNHVDSNELNKALSSYDEFRRLYKGMYPGESLTQENFYRALLSYFSRPQATVINQVRSSFLERPEPEGLVVPVGIQREVGVSFVQFNPEDEDSILQDSFKNIIDDANGGPIKLYVVFTRSDEGRWQARFYEASQFDLWLRSGRNIDPANNLAIQHQVPLFIQKIDDQYKVIEQPSEPIVQKDLYSEEDFRCAAEERRRLAEEEDRLVALQLQQQLDDEDGGAEARRQEEMRRLQLEAAQRRAQAEAVRRAQEEAAMRRQEEFRRLQQEEAQRRAQAEAARRAEAEAVMRRQEEIRRQQQEEAQRRAQAEAARRAQAEAAMRRQEEMRRQQQEAQQRAQAEAAQRAQVEAALRRQEELRRRQQAEAQRKAQPKAVQTVQAVPAIKPMSDAELRSAYTRASRNPAAVAADKALMARVAEEAKKGNQTAQGIMRFVQR